MFFRTGRLPQWWNLSNPFEELEKMKTQMERFTRDALKKSGVGVFPLVNITEDKEKYYVRAELSGLKADDLNISVTGNSLSIGGERKIQAESKDVKYHRREREAGIFNRVITLPGQTDTANIEAKFTDGILTIILPKAEEAKPKQIIVK